MMAKGAAGVELFPSLGFMVRVESGSQLINHKLCSFKQSLFRVSVFVYPFSDMGAHMEDKCCFHKKEKKEDGAA